MDILYNVTIAIDGPVGTLPNEENKITKEIKVKTFVSDTDIMFEDYMGTAGIA